MEHDSANLSVKKIDRAINYVVRHAYIRSAIFVVALLEATISPLLPELVVAAVLSYRKDISWKVLSVISALGSTAGVAILYTAGKFLYKTYQVTFDGWFASGGIATYGAKALEGNTFITMFFASFTPLPDRVFAFLSGVYTLPFFIVLLAFFSGRLLRVSIVAYFSFHFGDEARRYIIKHTRTATIIIVAVVLLYLLLRLSGIL